MRVLRIEYDGGGMYRGVTGGNAWVEAECYTTGGDRVDRQAHPLPFEDSLLRGQPWDALCCDRDDRGGRFGFADLAQLRRWIYRDEWVQRLSDVGCELVEYEAHGKCYVGYTQVVFDIRDATEISRAPLCTILEK